MSRNPHFPELDPSAWLETLDEMYRQLIALTAATKTMGQHDLTNLLTRAGGLLDEARHGMQLRAAERDLEGS